MKFISKLYGPEKKEENSGEQASKGSSVEVGEFLTVSEVAETLKCSTKQVYVLIESHGLPAFRLGREYRVDSKELGRWVLTLQEKKKNDDNT